MMKRRSSKLVSLVLITSVLASCARPQEKEEEEKQRVFMRADSSAPYTEVTEQYQNSRSGGMGMGSAFLWYMAFRPLMGAGMGYASNGLAPKSNVGTNKAKAQAVKTQTTRGGFGSSAKNTSAAS